jgi:LPS sulfotransferase NodH
VTRYLDLYRIILKTFGFRIRPIGTFALKQAHTILNAGTLAADHLIAPSFKDRPIDRPVFILGNPRSGTTFLHRFLLNTDRLAAFELWEMLFPAVTARHALGPFVDRLAPLSPARYHSAAAHETSLRDVETDDAMALFRFVDGGFLWTYFRAWEDTWGSESARACFDLDNEPAAEIEKHFRYMEGCWRRNLHVKDKARIAVKASSYTLRVKTLLKRYPDCKLLYMVRDPVETIPSGMSMITGVLEQSYDMFHSTREEDRKRYLENLYQASCHLFRTFHEVWKAGEIPEKNLCIVRYPRMMADLEATMREVVDFLEVDPQPGFWPIVREQAEKQRQRKSPHVYSLEKYGLTAQRIRSDLDFVYRDFDLDTSPSP